MRIATSFKTALAASLLLVATLSFASPQPQACPTVASIRGTQFMGAEYSAELGGYLALGFGSYGTRENWGVTIFPVSAGSANDAQVQSNSLIKTLPMSQPARPVYEDSSDIWYCIYKMGSVNVVSFTPLNLSSVSSAVKSFQ